MAEETKGNSTSLLPYEQCYFLGAPADFTLEFSETYITIIVINCLVCLPTILGNILIILGIWIMPILHTPSNVILVGLACSDLGVGIIVPVLNIARILPKLQGARVDAWCTVQVAYTFFGVMFCGVSFLTVAALSIDKYLALHWHLRYTSIVTTKRIIYMLVSFWVIFGAMSTVQIWSMAVYRTSVFIVLAIFLCGTSFTYFRIYKVLRRHKVQIQSQSQATDRTSEGPGRNFNMARYRKSVTSMFVVYCLFLLCYLPYITVQATILVTEMGGFHGNPSSHSRLYVAVDFTETIVILNSLTNPLIYCLRMRDVRHAAKVALLILRCKPAEQWQSERSHVPVSS